MMYALMVLGALAIGAAWDGWRRYVEVKRFNEALLERLKLVEDQSAGNELRLQRIGEKLATVATARTAPALRGMPR